MARFSAPSGSQFYKPSEHDGALTLFEPLGIVRDFVFPGSGDAPRDAMRANVYVLGGEKAEKFFDQTITQSVLVNAMRQAEEPYVLGRVVKGKKAWLIQAPTSDDEKAADGFLDALEGTAPAASGTDTSVPF